MGQERERDKERKRESGVMKNFSTVKDVNVISEIRASIPLWAGKRELRGQGTFSRLRYNWSSL